MFRRFRLQSLFALLLALCLASAALWSVSADAIEDAISDEVQLASLGHNHHAPVKKACNDGCHAQTQLTGLDGRIVAVPHSPTAQAPWIEYRSMLLSRPQEGPFRPPRPTAQA